MKKKIVAIVTIILVLGTMLTCLAACNKPAKKKYVVGTYKLTKYTEQYYQQEGITDKMTTYEIESYLVLGENGKGYYVYKDKDTPMKAKEIKIQYEENEDKKIISVKTWEKDDDKERIYKVKFQDEKQLVDRWTIVNKFFTRGYDIKYTKISKAQDLSAVKSVVGDIPVYEYGMYQYTGMYETSIDYPYNQYDPNIYKFVNVDVINASASIYTALKADKVQKVETCAVSFVKDADGKVTQMKVGDVVYDRYVGGFRRNITLNVNGQEVEAMENLYCVLNEVKTYGKEYFDEKITEYENSQNQG